MVDVPNPEGLTEEGTHFGKFRIVRKIGEGGFGVVYEALLPGPMGFSKRLAIKKLRAHLVDKAPTFVESMINEARIGGLLHHANIVDILEFGQVSKQFFLAMEYVDGITLREIIELCRQRRVMLPGFAIIDIASQVCRGLHYAHNFRDGMGPLNLVHRDLKPTNIIVDMEGTAKILDFGIAKAASNLYGVGKVTSATGTPRYMSPEQLAGDGMLTPQSDIYSLGLVLYELITARSFYAGETIQDISPQITAELPRDRMEGAEAAMPGCRPILERALQIEPTDRYEDARAMAADIRKLGQEYPPEADMAEVIARLKPAVELTRTQGSTGSGMPANSDLSMESVSGPRDSSSSSRGSAGDWRGFRGTFSGEGSGPRESGRPEAASGPSAPSEPSEFTGYNVSAGWKRLVLPVVAVLTIVLLAVVGYSVISGGERGRDSVAGADGAEETRDEIPGTPVSDEPTPAVEPGAIADPTEPTPADPPAADPPPPEPFVPDTPAETEAKMETETEPVVEEPPPPPPAQPGTVTLRTRPWAEIYLDGTLIESDIILRQYPVAGGQHTIRLVCTAREGKEKTFHFEVDGKDVKLGCWDFETMAACVQ